MPLFNALGLFAQDAPAPGGSGMGALLLAFVVAMVVMTLMSSRAQKKDRQRLRDWVNALEKNTAVITRGGIHGTVHAIKENVVILKIDDDKGTRLTVSKDAVIGVPEEARKDT